MKYTTASPCGAVGERDIGSDVLNVNNRSRCSVFSSVHCKLVGNFDLFCNIFTADFVLTEAQ